ncbi:hypothetical protein E8E15_006621 [Penicillium rubens]|uniref:uncharacterized protein n=1 Tax=Penicillium rubens TaxID=1108849 RepID=UPI001DA9F6A3|nr:uncharacterized protein N7525_000576 [Penicillium rubens]KAF3020433.1 hypothetical protein E8E15_006621 [Penicillium rubens]KAJ5842835.1 hypothetical protein N7525_000576 [Penicillium rubens]
MAESWDDGPTTAALEQSHRRTRPPSRPLRLDSLRRYAAGYKAWIGAEGMWIRTNYDAENEEAHQILWNDYMDISQVIGPDSLVLVPLFRPFLNTEVRHHFSTPSSDIFDNAHKMGHRGRLDQT